MKKPIAVINPYPCSAAIDFNSKFFIISCSAWSRQVSVSELEDLGWKLWISWHPTYSLKTKDIKVIKKTIKHGAYRFTVEAYKKFFNKKPSKIIDELISK